MRGLKDHSPPSPARAVGGAHVPNLAPPRGNQDGQLSVLFPWGRWWCIPALGETRNVTGASLGPHRGPTKASLQCASASTQPPLLPCTAQGLQTPRCHLLLHPSHLPPPPHSCPTLGSHQPPASALPDNIVTENWYVVAPNGHFTSLSFPTNLCGSH